jgi:DNA repair protein RecO (recombination protein O)
MTESCAAVLLRIHPLGEADVLVVAHTERWGKVRAAARSARRSKRRFAGGLSAGAVGAAELHPGRGGGLWRLDGFVPRLDHGAMGRDLDRFAFIAYLCELTDVLVEEHHSEPGLHAALEWAIGVTLEHAPDALTLRRYEIALLHHLGLLPSFEACCVCGAATVDEDVPFDAVRGGALCPIHGHGAARQPGEVLRSATALLAGESVELSAPGLRRALRDLLRAQIHGHLRAPLRSVELFAHLGRPRAGAAADGAP